MDKYQVFDVIGDGTYGTVYRGVNKETNEKVAIKKLKDKIKSWNECMAQTEVRILKQLNHENIVKLNEVIREPSSEVSFIFEYCDTNLFEFIDRHRKRKDLIPEYKIKNIIYQILNGLNYLHLNGFMHRDLKPENILYTEKRNQVKIADFGVAKEIPSFKNDSLTDYVCTRWYRAPECVLKSKNYNSSIDIWAVGCVMIEMYNLKPFFAGMDEFDQLNKIVNILGTPDFNEWPEGFKLIQKLGMKFPVSSKKDLKNIVIGACDDAITLLNDIFQYDSKKRPNCSQLINYSYFKEFKHNNNYSYGNNYNINDNQTKQKYDSNYYKKDISYYNFNNNYSFPNLQINNDNKFNKNLYQDSNDLNIEKSSRRDYGINYRDYINNGNINSNSNSIFEKNNYQTNFNNNNSYYNKNKFSSLVQNNIFNGNRRKYVNNLYNGINNESFFSKYDTNNYNTNYGDNFTNKPSLGRLYNYGNFIYN